MDASSQQILNSLESALLILEADESVVFANTAGLEILSSARDLILSKLRASKSQNFKDEIIINSQTYLLNVSELEDKSLVELLPLRNQDLGKTTHELKRPLQNIKALTEALIMGAKNDSAKLDQYLANIVSETDRMGALVNDLLKLAHLSSPGFVPQLVTVNLLELVTKTLAVLKAKAASKSIGFDVDLESVAELQADKDLLTHLLENLIDNAIKYNREGGSVTIFYSDGSLVVSDTGIGISEKDQGYIFDDFYSAANANQESTGLGLAIVKRIVELHGWKIDLKSELGKGSSFIISAHS